MEMSNKPEKPVLDPLLTLSLGEPGLNKGQKHHQQAPAATTALLNGRWKLLDTLATYAAFFSHALWYGVTCQTLIDLEYYTSSSTDEVAMLFTWRGVGFGIGCILLGHVFDIINHDLLLGICMVASGVCSIVIPRFHTLTPIAIIIAIQAVPFGMLTVGTTMVLVSYWKNPAPYIQTQHLLFSVALLLSPWVCLPFTGPLVLNSEDTKDGTNGSYENYAKDTKDGTNGSYENYANVSRYLQNISGSITPETNTTSNILNGNTTRILEFSDVEYIYPFVGMCLCLTGFICFLVWIKQRTWRVTLKNKNQKMSDDESVSDIRDKHVVIKVLLFTVLLTLESSTECGFSGLLVIFIIKHLKWSKETAMVITSVLFFTNIATRLAVAIILKWVKPFYILIVNLILFTFALFVLSLLVDKHPSVMWVCTVVIGLSFTTTVPVTLSWAASQVNTTGKVTSIFMTAFSTSMFLGPSLLGHIFDRQGHMWYCYILSVYAVIIDVLTLITWAVTKQLSRKDRQFYRKALQFATEELHNTNENKHNKVSEDN